MIKSLSMQLVPRYQCHKIVRALKVADRVTVCSDGSVWVDIADGGFEPLHLPQAVVTRYIPSAGDYVIFYDDDYVSVSPGKVFEEGYTRI